MYTVKNAKNILRSTSSTTEIGLWSRWEAKSHIETRKFPHLEEIFKIFLPDSAIMISTKSYIVGIFFSISVLTEKILV
jgi:hypothetical protein